MSSRNWLLAPQERLLELTGGEVFTDSVGELTSLREHLDYYPKQIWIYLMAAQWRKIAQREALVARAGVGGDDLGSRLVLAGLVREIVRLAFLLERRYAPWDQWLARSLTRLRRASRLGPLLSRALSAYDWMQRELRLMDTYAILAALHNNLGLTKPLETASERGERGFLTIHADRFANRPGREDRGRRAEGDAAGAHRRRRPAAGKRRGAARPGAARPPLRLLRQRLGTPKSPALRGYLRPFPRAKRGGRSPESGHGTGSSPAEYPERRQTEVRRRGEELQPPATGGVKRRRLLVFEAHFGPATTASPSRGLGDPSRRRACGVCCRRSPLGFARMATFRGGNKSSAEPRLRRGLIACSYLRGELARLLCGVRAEVRTSVREPQSRMSAAAASQGSSWNEHSIPAN